MSYLIIDGRDAIQVEKAGVVMDRLSTSQMGLFDTPGSSPPNSPASEIKPKKRVQSGTVRADVPSSGASLKSRPVKRMKTGRKKALPSPRQRVSSGLVPAGDIRLTANIREDLHLQLKIVAAQRRTTIGELIEELVENYLESPYGGKN
jgi:hypothetical protein